MFAGCVSISEKENRETMTALTTNLSPGGRVEAGDGILERAKNHDVKSVKARLASFEKVHAAYVKASGTAQAKLEGWRAALALVAERDVDQDDAVDGLALALANDGAPRVNPFKGLSKHGPARLKALSYDKQPDAVRALAAKVAKRKGASKATLAAAKRCVTTANAVDKALASAKAPDAAYRKALAARDALERSWSTSFAALKRLARFNDAEGTTTGLADALFTDTAAAPKKRAKKAKPADA